MKNILLPVGLFIVAIGVFIFMNKNMPTSDELYNESSESVSRGEKPTTQTATPEQVTLMQEEARRASKDQKVERKQKDEEVEERLTDGGQAPLTEEELDELEEYFDQVETQWTTDMENFITKELRMPKDVYEKYETLREAYEKEKYQAFNDFHEEMFKKHGTNYSYNPSEFNTKFENTFRDEYLVKMKDLIGEENMTRYLEMLDATNERLMRDARPGHGHISIDI
jgi:hypothetical protein